jgi:hypothetical protein
MAKPALKTETSSKGGVRLVRTQSRGPQNNLGSLSTPAVTTPSAKEIWSDKNLNAKANVIHVDFNARQRIDKGVEKTESSTQPIRKITTTPLNSEAPLHSTVDQNFSEQYTKEPELGSSRKTKKITDREQVSLNEDSSQTAPRAIRTQPQAIGGVRGKVLGAVLGYSLQASLRTTSVNLWMSGYLLAFWSFQIFISLLCTISLILVGVLKAATGLLDKFNNFIKEATGFDIGNVFSSFDPSGFVMMMWMILIGYTVFILFFMYINYIMSGLKPLSGRGANFKIGMCLLMIIGTVAPLISFLPWFLVWQFAVQKYPK